MSTDQHPEVTFGPFGTVNPPRGGEWHRSTFTKEMLEGGYRPLLKYPARDAGEYEGSVTGKDWNKFQFGEGAPGGLVWAYWRTKRPMPELGPDGTLPKQEPPSDLETGSNTEAPSNKSLIGLLGELSTINNLADLERFKSRVATFLR